MSGTGSQQNSFVSGVLILFLTVMGIFELLKKSMIELQVKFFILYTFQLLQYKYTRYG